MPTNTGYVVSREKGQQASTPPAVKCQNKLGGVQGVRTEKSEHDQPQSRLPAMQTMSEWASWKKSPRWVTNT